MSEDVLKEERDKSNKAQYLEDVAITEEDAKNHPPITHSRKKFFEDLIDDILRGNITAEDVPNDLKKTVAILLSDYNDPQIKETEVPYSFTTGENTAVEQTSLPTMTSSELKEKFSIDPPSDQSRDATDEELDTLLEDFKPDDEYIQNEEQTPETLWQKTKELDIPEPEKNEVILPSIEEDKNEEGEVIETFDPATENIEVTRNTKITRHKKRLLTDQEYSQRIENRINDLITKLENNEIKMDILTKEDQKVIIDILNSNE